MFSLSFSSQVGRGIGVKGADFCAKTRRYFHISDLRLHMHVDAFVHTGDISIMKHACSFEKSLFRTRLLAWKILIAVVECADVSKWHSRGVLWSHQVGEKSFYSSALLCLKHIYCWVLSSLLNIGEHNNLFNLIAILWTGIPVSQTSHSQFPGRGSLVEIQDLEIGQWISYRKIMKYLWFLQ